LNLIHALDEGGGNLPLPKRPISKEELILPQWTAKKADKNKLLDTLIEMNESIAQAEKIILLNPNASDIIPLRKWPIKKYIRLAKLLIELEGTFIVITGIESEKTAGETIRRSLKPERCLNLAGWTSFTQLLDLYSVSDILITNDSGPAHFASMTGIETFVLFGPETPKLYRPLGENNHVFYAKYSCSPCVSVFNHRRSPCRDNRCLKSITVEEVYHEVRKKIGAL
jgi:ADP-heptose:LPS heptosyltransferase